MKKVNTRTLVEAGIMIALAQILSYIGIFHMPAGGTVTPGSMVPIMVFAIRWGPRKGLLVGAIYGVLQFLLGAKYSLHPVSLLFDYPIAFAFIGLSGVFGRKLKNILAGVVLGVAGRFACHVLSGVVVFASYAPEGQHPLVYSIIYNGTFLLPELLISIVILLPVVIHMRLLAKSKNL